MKAKKILKKKGNKAAPAKAPVEKDEWGFRKGSKSSQAVKMIASGKTSLKDTRKKFNTLSFATLLAQLQKNGFKVKEASPGSNCTVVGKA